MNPSFVHRNRGQGQSRTWQPASNPGSISIQSPCWLTISWANASPTPA